ncbi:hypothetical protein P5673_016678 [Acropora cervicornis]|uniref:Uncharacterized protein n=1 Tax=Acropora cervicornis TaxID=6130 RepID=A0AAD9V3X8_ACRCE|nr:hypothetical protein P5673_016678 [Acropora cervicornis]
MIADEIAKYDDRSKASESSCWQNHEVPPFDESTKTKQLFTVVWLIWVLSKIKSLGSLAKNETGKIINVKINKGHREA